MWLRLLLQQIRAAALGLPGEQLLLLLLLAQVGRRSLLLLGRLGQPRRASQQRPVHLRRRRLLLGRQLGRLVTSRGAHLFRLGRRIVLLLLLLLLELRAPLAVVCGREGSWLHLLLLLVDLDWLLLLLLLSDLLARKWLHLLLLRVQRSLLKVFGRHTLALLLLHLAGRPPRLVSVVAGGWPRGLAAAAAQLTSVLLKGGGGNALQLARLKRAGAVVTLVLLLALDERLLLLLLQIK